MSDGAIVWPEKASPALHHVLGMMCFQLGPMAHAYAGAGEYIDATGEQLPSRAEDEQAFMLHKFIGFVAAHGEKWHEAAADDLDRVVAIVKAKAAA